MRIRIIKDTNGHRLICTRRNGTWTEGRVGPGLPQHDLAHYVVERAFHWHDAFFGSIAAGKSLEEMHDPAVIRSLPREALMAEAVVRALQGLSNGSVAQQDFIPVVEEEVGSHPRGLDGTHVLKMLEEYIALLNAWENVAEGSALELRWM